MPKSRILVIDDEAAIRDSLKMTLEYDGYEFVGAATGQEGLALVEVHQAKGKRGVTHRGQRRPLVIGEALAQRTVQRAHRLVEHQQAR